MAWPKVIACGLFRTGTTYLQELLEANLDVRHANGYKHAHDEAGYSHFDLDSIKIITYKHPLKWIDSLVRNSFDLIDDFDLQYEKGHTPIAIAFRDDNCPDDEPVMVQVSLEKIMEIYNRHWNFWETKECFKVRHFDMAFEPEKWLEIIAKQYSIKIKPTFRSIQKVKGSEPFRPDYYSDRYKTDHLSSKQIERIKQLTLPEVDEWMKS